MKLVIGSDHGGFQLKSVILAHLEEKGITVEDVGTYQKAPAVDYPFYGYLVGEKVASKQADLGIAICGAGIGMSVASNKISGIRASLCHDTFSARATREHNDSNVLCLGERVIGEGLACLIVDEWLSATYQGGRHAQRVQMLDNGKMEEAG